MMPPRWLLMTIVMAVGAPAAATAQSLAIRGATIHTLAGPAIPDGTVVIEDGRIVAVGQTVSVPAGARVLDAVGLHVYPGFFDASSQLGMAEIGQVPVTVDTLELGEFNPHLLAFTAVHPSSEHLPVARANGITHAVAAPQSSTSGVGGQASVVALDGWTVEEMLVTPSVGFAVNWPAIRLAGRGYADARRMYDEEVRRLARWLEDARRYDAAVAAGQPVPRDLKLEAFSTVTRGERPLLVNASDERYIRAAIEFAAAQDVRVVIAGGQQAWKLRAELAEQGIPVILGPTQALPSGPDEPYHEQYVGPALLHEAGVTFAFASFGASDSRRLPFQAGNAVAYGLPHEEAIKALTLRAAEIFGLADRLGTIEAGKLANLIVADGDPLEYTTRIRHVIIAGRDVGLGNRHEELYERYRQRPTR